MLILIDNVGYGDLGCYGNLAVKTPHLDALATQGVRCLDFYIPSSSCMPSRGALLTGRHPLRTGLNEQVWRIDEMEQRVLPLRESLLPSYLKPGGYLTACFGKWNLGFAPGHRPTERGFDEFFGHASGNMHEYTHVYNGRNDLFRGIEPVIVEGHSTDLFADAACEFIRRNARKPFFVYLPFNAVHFPNPVNFAPGDPVIWQAPAEAFSAYGCTPDEPDPRRRYLAVLTALDAGIGRVLAQLEKLRLAENTLVIVLSDNGAFMLKNRGLEVASNAPLRDGGTTTYEGGIRVPCIIRWPGRIAAGTVCREPLVSLDLLPLILDAASRPLPADRVLDGRNPLAALAGKAASPHESLFFEYGKFSALRTGRYKLVRANPDAAFELYDLETDIAERKNLASEKPDVVARLSAARDRWLKAIASAKN
ncbi:MAG: sulfatase-like hydrolase/transferase [Opitutaceae bacterium]|nr:sulfatase-like hydrolase/transferase [Opitutaceae bacterium]